MQRGIVFALAPSLHSFWGYFSTDLHYHIGHLPTWGVHLSLSYLFAFSYSSWGSQGKNTEMVCIPFSSGTHSVRPLHHDLSILGGPTRHGLVRQALVRVIRLASYLWFQSVCPLMPSLSTYHLT